MRLLPSPPSRLLGGRILFDGQDLVTLSERAMQEIRGDRIGMIFQEPMTSLNPVWTVGFQLAEAVRLHRPVGKQAARERALELLRQVGVSAAERRLDQYPHELSGGLRQRVMIAMAIACSPDLVIADEPTTALDVTIQAQILDLLKRLRAELGMAVLMITHDLGVVAEFCDRVVVMYAGRVVETAPARDLFAAPRHPYTAGLLASMPRLSHRRERLPTIPGMVPAPADRGDFCPFADRCPRLVDRCRMKMPALAPPGDGVAGRDRTVACWNPEPMGAPAEAAR
jgi:oligopeptide/dipeptide ABC transporter ATP-binding protein